MRVVFAPGARAEIASGATWWAEHHPEAPDVFRAELAAALRQLPDVAAELPRFRRAGLIDVRRLAVPRLQRHVYFYLSADRDLVVLAVWGAARAVLPQLGGRTRARR